MMFKRCNSSVDEFFIFCCTEDRQSIPTGCSADPPGGVVFVTPTPPFKLSREYVSGADVVAHARFPETFMLQHELSQLAVIRKGVQFLWECYNTYRCGCRATQVGCFSTCTQKQKICQQQEISLNSQSLGTQLNSINNIDRNNNIVECKIDCIVEITTTSSQQ